MGKKIKSIKLEFEEKEKNSYNSNNHNITASDFKELEMNTLFNILQMSHCGSSCGCGGH